MGRRGPPPKPTALRVLQGNPGHRPLNAEEPAPPPATNARCPARLKGTAREFWKRHAPTCLAIGTLTESDLDTFAAGCVAWKELRDLELLSAKLGIQTAIQQGIRKDLHATRADYMRFAQRFGLDPSSRSNVKATPPARAQKAKSFEDRIPKLKSVG